LKFLMLAPLMVTREVKSFLPRKFPSLIADHICKLSGCDRLRSEEFELLLAQNYFATNRSWKTFKEVFIMKFFAVNYVIS
jgi:hypothetical protein